MNKINQFIKFSKNQTLHNIKQQFYRPRRYTKPGMSQIKQTTEFKETRKIHSFYNFGMYAAVFGFAFGMVPLYRIFCEHVGIAGDYNQKDYSQKAKEVKNTHRKFRVRFKSEADPEVNWEFEPVQDELFVNAGETALMFYRAYNAEADPVIGFSTYNVYPEEAQVYFSKIQCFCFNQQLINPKEELQLPLYFYLEPEILDNDVLQDTNEIRIIYSFIKCAKQDMLKYVEEELERVQKNKEFLQELRDKKKALKSQEELEQDKISLQQDLEQIKALKQKKKTIELLELKEMEEKEQKK